MCFLIAGGDTSWSPRQWQPKRYPVYIAPDAIIRKRRSFGLATCESEKCGSRFDRAHKTQKYCRSSCRWAAQSKPIVDGLLQCVGPCGRKLPATAEHFRRSCKSAFGFTSRCSQCLREYHAARHGRIGPMGVESRFSRGAIWETSHNGERSRWEISALSVCSRAELIVWPLVDGKRAKRTAHLQPSWMTKFGHEVVAGEMAAE